MTLFKHLVRQVAIVSVLTFCVTGGAWAFNASFGYGSGPQYDKDLKSTGQNNTTWMAEMSVFSLPGVVPWFDFSVQGGVAKMHTDATANNQNLTTASIAPQVTFSPFGAIDFFASIGPSYMSNTQFGTRTLAKRWAMRDSVGVGYHFAMIGFSLRTIYYGALNPLSSEGHDGVWQPWVAAVDFRF